MRRLPAMLLSAALTVPVTTMLPTISFAAARPAPVATRIAAVGVSGVDGAALAAPDNGRRASAAALDAVSQPSGTSSGTSSAAVTTTTSSAARTAAATARPFVLSTPRRTGTFSSLGVTWDLPARGARLDVAVVVRTHSGKGWSGWTALDTDGADLRDDTVRSGLRGGTSAMWVGPSDGVQVRVDVRSGPAPTGIRAELIDPGTSSYDAVAGVTPPGSAQAAAAQPAVNTRAAWGADERRVRAAPTYMPTINAAVIHHTTDTNNYTAAQVPGIIRADYAYHLSRGWSDIGYNFLVDKYGRIWEGRRGGIAAAVQGAHAGGFNTATFGVSVIGNYMTASPSPATLSALKRLIGWKLDLHHRDPTGSTVLTSAGNARYRAGTQVRVPVVMGHRDVGYTDCPGTRLYPYLSAIRAGAASVIGAALINPALSSSGGPYGGGGTTVTSSPLTSQAWHLRVTNCAGTRVFGGDGWFRHGQTLTKGWNARVGTVPARPGVYDVRLDSNSSRTWARPVTGTYTVNAPPPPAAPVGSVSQGPGGYVPITPARLLDTRSGPVVGIGAGGRVDVKVTGRAGIPNSGVTGVVLNVTGVCPTATTALTVWPAGRAKPAPTTVTVPVRDTRTGTVVVPIGAAGKISVGSSSAITDVVVDAVGYVGTSATTRLLTVPTVRAYDTRVTSGVIGAGGSRNLMMPAVSGIAASAQTGVVAQITVINPGGRGWLTARRPGQTPAATTSLWYRAGGTTTALAVLSPDRGHLVLDSRGSTVHVTIDVVGVWTADGRATSTLTAISPVRAFSSASTGGAFTAGQTRTATVTGGGTGVPVDATAVLVGLTATGGGAASSLTVWPAGQSRPSRVDLVSGPGGTASNLALVPVGAGGRVSVSSSAGSPAVTLDVLGYARAVLT